MERKVKDAEREYKAIVSQLQVKEARQVELEKRIHEINMSRARRRAKEQQEMARIKGTVIVSNQPEFEYIILTFTVFVKD